ncbi:ATP-binding protein [Streptomyces sp. NPDC002516]
MLCPNAVTTPCPDLSAAACPSASSPVVTGPASAPVPSAITAAFLAQRPSRERRHAARLVPVPTTRVQPARVGALPLVTLRDRRHRCWRDEQTRQPTPHHAIHPSRRLLDHPACSARPDLRDALHLHAARRRLARRLAAHRLDAWGIPYDTYEHDAIVLVTAELTVNAVRHGHVPGRDFHLRLRMAAPSRTVRIEVTDTRAERVPPRPDALRTSGAEETDGRGLLLVAGLAARWDWHLRPDGPGKTVWAECTLTHPR